MPVNYGTKLKQRLSYRLELLEKAGLTVKTLARVVHLPEEAVARVLVDPASAPYGHVTSITGAVGLKPDGKRLYKADVFVKRRAKRKARYLVGLVQGTMGLEAQAVEPTTKKEMVKSTYRHLLADRRKIWG